MRRLRRLLAAAASFVIALAVLVTSSAGGAAALAGGTAGGHPAHVAAAPAPGYPAAPPTRGALDTDGQDARYLLGGSWLYRPDTADQGLGEGWWRDAASTDGWNPVAVPNSYNTGDYSTLSMYGYVGWYRRDFTLPSGAFARYVPRAARAWIIQFESVNYRATVWLNGYRLGDHAGAYLPFEFPLRHLRAGVNRLVVRVDDRRDGNSFPGGPSGGWWNFGGILDAVYLRPVQRADISALTIRPLLACPGCAATVHETAVVRNISSRPQRVELTGRYGGLALHFGTATIAPGGTWTARGAALVAHPRLWAPGHPALYRATATLADSQGRRLGGYTWLSGIRTITRTARGRLELNGRLLNLRGVNLHEQDVTTGAALSVAQMRRRISLVRQLGATLIRAHYPLDPEMEEMADRDGILLWSEIPVYNIPAANLGLPAWRGAALALLRANIDTNQDHPSILLWSIGNELPTPATAAEAGYIARAASEAHRLDPTRPVAMAVSDWPGVGCTTAYAPLDVIGVNEYFGWFDAGGGTTDDREALGPFLDSVRACYPRQGLMVSEFGFNGNRHGPVDARGTYEFQDDAVAYHLGVFARKRWLSGAIYFNLMDFAAKPGYDGANPLGAPPFVTNGLVDTTGAPKPAFGVVAAVYHHTLQIGR